MLDDILFIMSCCLSKHIFFTIDVDDTSITACEVSPLLELFSSSDILFIIFSNSQYVVVKLCINCL